MSINHAPWATPPPPVTTGGWDQESWDKYAEKYRPKEYTGDIRDHRGYMLWGARRHVEAAKEYEERGRPSIEGGFFVTPLATKADIENHIRVANMCGCGECFCCAVKEINSETTRSEKP